MDLPPPTPARAREAPLEQEAKWHLGLVTPLHHTHQHHALLPHHDTIHCRRLVVAVVVEWCVVVQQQARRSQARTTSSSLLLAHDALWTLRPALTTSTPRHTHYRSRPSTRRGLERAGRERQECGVPGRSASPLRDRDEHAAKQRASCGNTRQPQGAEDLERRE